MLRDTGYVAGRILQSATAPQGAPRVLLIIDMEGASGIDDFRMTSYSYPDDYERGREHLISDVNAVVVGLFSGGAQSVSVWDNHGSGVPGGQNVPSSRLDKRAHLLSNDQPWQQGTYDAVALVGMHAGAGSGGFLAHTGTFGGEWVINGMNISESELHGFDAAYRANIPIIFSAGDDVLHQRMRIAMPWVQYVEVKRALSPRRAQLYPDDSIRAALTSGAARSVRLIADAKVTRLRTPIVWTFRATPPMNLTPVFEAQLPEYTGEFRMDPDSVVSVTVVRTSYDDAARAIGPVRGLARTLGWTSVTRRALYAASPNARTTNTQALVDVWLTDEAKRAHKPTAAGRP